MSDREIMEIYRSGAQEQAFNLIAVSYTHLTLPTIA